MRRVFSVTSVTNGKEFHSVSATLKPCTLTYCCWLSRISPAHLTPSPPVQLGSPLALNSQLSPTLFPFLLHIFSLHAPQGRCSVLPPSLSPGWEGEGTHSDTHTHKHTFTVYIETKVLGKISLVVPASHPWTERRVCPVLFSHKASTFSLVIEYII